MNRRKERLKLYMEAGLAVLLVVGSPRAGAPVFLKRR